MLQLQKIREDKDLVINRLSVRGLDANILVNSVLELDQKRRETQVKLDDVLSKRNTISKEIGAFFKAGNVDEANRLKEETALINDNADKLRKSLSDIEKELNDILYQLPNLPHESVPNGKTSAENEIVMSKGDIPVLHKEAKPHWDLAKEYNLIDFELGVKITGAGFPVYKGKGAKLQRALINFFLDEAEKAGYKEIIPPYMVNEASGYGTGQLPDKEGQMYYVSEDDLYLIPTAEVPVTNIFRGEMLKKEDFPIKYTAYSPCFRREAGSYGKDVRGLNRLHQFEKVEVVQVQHPSKSYETLNEMVDYVKSLLEKLELPYRLLKLCGGDMGFTSALTYDFEVYSAAQERWLEVSSVSNFESYQSNRLKLRFKNENGKKELAHTLNGSALALPRILASILENFQVEDGIEVPKVLHPYLSFDKI